MLYLRIKLAFLLLLGTLLGCEKAPSVDVAIKACTELAKKYQLAVVNDEFLSGYAPRADRLRLVFSRAGEKTASLDCVMSAKNQVDVNATVEYWQAEGLVKK